jgi:hypothetical protein
MAYALIYALGWCRQQDHECTLSAPMSKIITSGFMEEKQTSVVALQHHPS